MQGFVLGIVEGFQLNHFVHEVGVGDLVGGRTGIVGGRRGREVRVQQEGRTELLGDVDQSGRRLCMRR